MFEDLIVRARRAAARRARAHSDALAERIAGELPRGIAAEAGADGVRLGGRGLRRRFALDPALRWLIAGRVRW